VREAVSLRPEVDFVACALYDRSADQGQGVIDLRDKP